MARPLYAARGEVAAEERQEMRGEVGVSRGKAVE